MALTATNAIIAGNKITFTLPENSGFDGEVGISISELGTDIGTQSIDRILITGANRNLFKIDDNDNLIYEGTAQDFENAPTSFDIKLLVILTDSAAPTPGLSREIYNGEVSVTDVDEKPSDDVTVTMQTSAVDEIDRDTDIHIATISLDDDALGTNNFGNLDETRFEFRNPTKDTVEVWLKKDAVLDFETMASITQAISIDSTGDGDGPTSASFTLQVENVDEKPTSVTVTPSKLNMEEGISTATMLASLEITDDALGTNHFILGNDSIFEVRNQNGNRAELWLKKDVTLDYEATEQLVVDIMANGTGSGVARGRAQFELRITDSDEQPTQVTLSTSSATLTELSGDDMTTAQKLADITITDPDTKPEFQSNTPSLIDDHDGLFDVRKNSETGRWELWLEADKPLDYEAIAEGTIVVQVTAAGDGLTGNGAPPQSFTLTVANKIEFIDADDNSVTEYAFTETETATVTDVIGIVELEEPDFDHYFVFDIDSNSDGLFTIDSETGEISLARGKSLDFETAQSHTLSVIVIDWFSADLNSYTVNITINVTDVDENPTDMAVTPVKATLAEGTYGQEVALAEISFTDEDQSDAFRQNIATIAAHDSFEIRDNMLYLKAGAVLDFETASSINLMIDGPNALQGSFELQIENRPEIVRSGSQNLQINEGRNNAADTGIVYNLLEGDARDIELRLSDNRFSIDENGALRLRKNARFDYEDAANPNGEIALTVSAIDKDTGTIINTDELVLQITDAQLAITGIEYVNANETYPETVQAADGGKVVMRVLFDKQPADANITFKLGGKHKDYYSIDNAGNISLKSETELIALDLAPISRSTKHKLKVTLQLADESPKSHFDFDVNMLNVEGEIEATGYEGKPIVLAVPRHQEDGDAVTYKDTGKTATGNGSYSVVGGVLTWIPNAKIDFGGKDFIEEIFEVNVEDERGGESKQEVKITLHATIAHNGHLQAREDSPWADPEGNLAIADPSYTGDYTLSVKLGDGAAVEIDADGEDIVGSYGTFKAKADGTWEYVVDQTKVESLHGREGEDGHIALEQVTVTYQVGDETLTRSFTITISGLTDFYTSDGQNYSWNGITRDLSEHLSLHNSDTNLDTYIYGGSGDDILTGGDGNDRLRGWYGNDVLNGGAGADALYGGEGNDVLNGGAGYDKAWFSSYYGADGNLTLDATDTRRWKQMDDGSWLEGTDDSFIYQRFWADLNGNKTEDSADEFDYFTSIERFDIQGGNGNDVLNGGAGNDELHGWDGNDVLTGDEGDDTLWGGNGNDVLNGDEGNDFFLGLRGNDVMNGGDGNDRLYGGRDNDIFVLGAADEGLDRVGDFSFGGKSGNSRYDGTTRGGNDRIRVDVSDSQKTTVEALSTDAAKLAALQEAAQIRWTQSSSTIIYATKGTASEADDVAIMVLEDFTEALTIGMFEVV